MNRNLGEASGPLRQLTYQRPVLSPVGRGAVPSSKYLRFSDVAAAIEPALRSVCRLLCAFGMFGCGVVLIGFVLPDWLTYYWNIAVGSCVGIGAMMIGFFLFAEWMEGFF